MLKPVKKEKVRPQDFTKVVERNLENIVNTRFVIPKIGSGSFGYFEVEYKTPFLKEVRVGSSYV